MNYEKIYNDLMKDRLSKKPQRIVEKRCGLYFEGHHIIPKCYGGVGNSNRPKKSENIVLLTAREHFLAHWLLWLIYRDRKMALAFHKMMSNTKKTNRITNSKAYSEAREAFRITNMNNKYGVGTVRVVSDEQKKKQSKIMKGRYAGSKNPFYGKKHTNETLEKLKKPKSKEHIEKLKIANKSRIKIQCPFCNKKTDNMNAKKWHFDNCLKNPNGHSRKQTNFVKNNHYGCKKIMDMKTNKVFNSIKEAAIYYDMHPGSLTRWLKTGKNICYL